MPTPTGIDIGGSTIKVATPTATATSDPYTNPDADTIRNAITQALDRAGVDTLTTVGLCLPGIVEDNRIEHAANLPRLSGVDIHTLVPIATHVRIETDVRAAAHDVWHERRMPGRLLAIAIGTGVGACVLDDGEPLRVSGQSSGHIGHIDIENTPLEAIIGAEALRRAGIDLDTDTITLPAAHHAALTSAVRTCHAIYRPNHITLLGGIGMRFNIMALKDSLTETPLARTNWTLTTGWTTYHAAQGVAHLASTLPPPPS